MPGHAKTTWIPQATVEKVVPRGDVGCELAIEELDRLASQGFEAIRGDFAGPALDDQVAALQALAAEVPEYSAIMGLAFFASLGLPGLAGFVSMMVFLAILVVGFVYEWKKGALDWSSGAKRGDRHE